MELEEKLMKFVENGYTVVTEYRLDGSYTTIEKEGFEMTLNNEIYKRYRYDVLERIFWADMRVKAKR